jgi:hypothetical protein
MLHLSVAVKSGDMGYVAKVLQGLKEMRRYVYVDKDRCICKPRRNVLDVSKDREGTHTHTVHIHTHTHTHTHTNYTYTLHTHITHTHMYICMHACVGLC